MPDLLYDILRYAYWVLSVYFYFLIGTIILSWTPIRNTRFYDYLDRISAVYLRYFRGWIVVGNAVDLTPMVGLLLYQLLLSLIQSALR